MDTTTLVAIGGGISGAIIALWAVVARYIGRLEKKQDDSEIKREEQGQQILDLVSNQSKLDGRINGYLEAKNDLKDLNTMPEKVNEIHLNVLAITDAVTREEKDNG